MRKKVLATLLTAVLLGTLLAGCGSDPNAGSSTGQGNTDGGAVVEGTDGADASGGAQASSTGEPKYGGILRYCSGNAISAPGYTPENANNTSLLFLTTAYESLVTYSDDGSIIPLLATEWTVDADEPSITWTLREGVQFADGEPFNAEAVKRNVEEYQKLERSETAVVESMEVIDDTHIKMVLSSWSSSAIGSIGFYVYYMSPKAMEDVDALRVSSCGTGPFQVTEYNPGVSVKYAKNENYWQEGKPYLDGVEIYTSDSETTLSSAMQAGEYDLIMLADIQIMNDLMAVGSTSYGTIVSQHNLNGQGITICGLIPNSADENSPFADARVRRAMAEAIDGEAIVAAFGGGVYTYTDQWAAMDAVTYNKDITPIGYDPEHAKQLLAEAGYPDGFDTTIYVGPYVGDYFTAAAAMLEEVGIHCTLEQVDNATETAMYTANGWDGLMGHYATISPDLGLYMGRHLDYNGAFYAPFIQHPDDHMELLEKIRTATTEDEKVNYELQLQALIYDHDTGSALFGKPILAIQNMYFKYDYVKDDGRGIPEANVWRIADCWLDK